MDVFKEYQYPYICPYEYVMILKYPDFTNRIAIFNFESPIQIPICLLCWHVEPWAKLIIPCTSLLFSCHLHI